MSKEKQIEEMAEVIKCEATNSLQCPRTTCVICKATKMYNAGYRKQEWISVEERLPDKGKEVLAYRGDFNGDMMNTYTYLGSGNWEDDYGYRGSTEHEGITHWMPLPEAPKGGEE